MLGWSNPPADDDAGDLPDHAFILTGISVDPGDPTGVIVTGQVFIGRSEPFPVEMHDDDTIEPTAIFKPRKW